MWVSMAGNQFWEETHFVQAHASRLAVGNPTWEHFCRQALWGILGTGAPSTLPSNRAGARLSLLYLRLLFGQMNLWLTASKHLCVMEQVSGGRPNSRDERMISTDWFLFSVAYNLLYLRDWRKKLISFQWLFCFPWKGAKKIGYFSHSIFFLQIKIQETWG